LGPGGQVNDRESPVAEPDGAVHVKPVPVRPAVREQIGHPPQQCLVHGRAISTKQAGDTTHDQLDRAGTAT
jgi:hypothetical protein